MVGEAALGASRFSGATCVFRCECCPKQTLNALSRLGLEILKLAPLFQALALLVKVPE